MRIIVYRDGVAQNMFDEITEREIAVIRRACTTCPNTTGNYCPEIVFIVAQMRTKARFAEWRDGGKGKGKGKGKVKSMARKIRSYA